MSVEVVVKNLEENLKKAAEHLKTEYAHLQIGRASSAIVERIFVEAYGVMQPLKAIANISVPDAKTIQIQPWDRGTLQSIEKAITMSEIGLNPQNDGIVIRLNIPALTEDRRRELTKVVSKMAEETKITVRNVRQEAMEQLKKMHKDAAITEDQWKHGEKKVQEVVDHVNKEIDTSAKEKEEDIMKV